MSKRSDFLSDVVQGLSGNPRSLPCKYLYDERGSELFEAICDTRDYYVTRADLALHESHLEEISRLIGPNAHVIEFGSGAGVKTRHLLDALDSPRGYTPIEISSAALRASAAELKAQFPELDIEPLRADYTQPIDGEALDLAPPARRRVIYFPGSTISNFEHDEARDFLARMGRIVGPDGGILIGVDLLKDEQRLIQAYDDRDGVTAKFNLNILRRLTRDLDADIDIDAFGHEARFNGDLGRIEMHLVALKDTTIDLDGKRFRFDQGESIHTENSHKYSIEGFTALAESAGLRSDKVWTDPDALFSMHWLTLSEP
jgi:dimethylhistidine N-methyltransferase